MSCIDVEWKGFSGWLHSLVRPKLLPLKTPSGVIITLKQRSLQSDKDFWRMCSKLSSYLCKLMFPAHLYRLQAAAYKQTLNSCNYVHYCLLRSTLEAVFIFCKLEFQIFFNLVFLVFFCLSFLLFRLIQFHIIVFTTFQFEQEALLFAQECTVMFI